MKEPKIKRFYRLNAGANRAMAESGQLALCPYKELVSGRREDPCSDARTKGVLPKSHHRRPRELQ